MSLCSGFSFRCAVSGNEISGRECKWIFPLPETLSFPFRLRQSCWRWGRLKSPVCSNNSYWQKAGAPANEDVPVRISAALMSMIWAGSTPQGQAISQRLHWLHRSTHSSSAFSLSDRNRWASGPACLGPGKSGLTRNTGQFSTQIVQRMQCSKFIEYTPCRILPPHGLLPAPGRDRSRFSIFPYQPEYRRTQKYFPKANPRAAEMNPP